jgi:hypothetical protein
MWSKLLFLFMFFKVVLKSTDKNTGNKKCDPLVGWMTQVCVMPGTSGFFRCSFLCTPRQAPRHQHAQPGGSALPLSV